MATIRIGAPVTVLRGSKSLKGKIASIQADGVINVTLGDGSTEASVQHISRNATNGWYSQSPSEQMRVSANDAQVLEIS